VEVQRTGREGGRRHQQKRKENEMKEKEKSRTRAKLAGLTFLLGECGLIICDLGNSM
jgi:hypothetical protein